MHIRYLRAQNAVKR